MPWSHYVSYCFGGVFLTNAIPHLASGLTGRAFQSPFAKPPGKGLSSSIVNVLWGWLNVAVAYVLLVRVGAFDVRSGDVVAFGLGAVLVSIQLAHHFGAFHGGNAPK